MYAIIKDSGTQMRVEEGQSLRIDYREVKPGDELTFSEILLFGGEDGPKLGAPTIAGAKVTGKVVGTVLGDKIYVEKYRRRRNYRRRTGHRQVYTQVEIVSIEIPGVERKAKPAETPAE